MEPEGMWCERGVADVSESDMMEEEYWTNLTHLQICSDQELGSLQFPLSSDAVTNMRQEIEEEGYIHLEPEQLPWAIDIGQLATAVVTLRQAGWDPLWLLLFDATWILHLQVTEIVKLVFGNMGIFDFYAWYIDSRKKRAGWAPHRDRGDGDPKDAFRQDGTAKVNTIWIPLTDASADNSCLYVLPACEDCRYRNSVTDTNPIFFEPKMFQCIRCLPARAGSAVMFTSRLLHWGSKGKTSAVAPRIAISFAASTDDHELPYFSRDLLPLPPFCIRLALIAGQLIVYSEQEPYSREELEKFYSLFMYQHMEFDVTYVDKVKQAMELARKRIPFL
jgi:hypothetical protein